MSILTPNVFFWGEQPYPTGAATTAANPQLQFFENFPGHLGNGFGGASLNTLSIHAVNIPLSLSFNKVVYLLLRTAAVTASITRNVRFGLYSLNAGTLSLANSAGGEITIETAAAAFTSWISLNTSATQNITPGTWYFALMDASSGGVNWALQMFFNSSINPGNAIPGGFLMGRMTATTGAMPASMATSDLDITGSDAIRQPYIIITA